MKLAIRLYMIWNIYIYIYCAIEAYKHNFDRKIL